MGTSPGWYPDPEAPGGQRWWDGSQWTEHRQAAPPPSASPGASSDARNWAMAAHLSALVAAFVALAFLGPLLVYVVRRDDPFVRAHATEALNFNLSMLLYAVVGGAMLALLIILVVGLLLLPLVIAAGIAWIVLVVNAAIKASRGEPYRYPLTIRFVT